MYVLGIETSCDETAAAVLEFSATTSPRILAEEISSQIKIHEAYGGVVPELASREHMNNLPLVVEKVLKDSGIGLNKLSVIGVTRGPGLVGCLLMGLSFAQGISLAQGIPLIGVNHIEGHVLAPVMDNPNFSYPFLALVVSGGHTEILEVRAAGSYRLIARTIDDAAGEAFDKSANLIGLGYPGGPKLAALADTRSSSPFQLPKVMRGVSDFSFSGLKTAIAQLIQRQTKAEGVLSNEAKAELAWAIQDSIVSTLIHKLENAIQTTGISRVAVTGGVSANRCLRLRIAALAGVESAFPSNLHCMDNAAMIGYVAGIRFQAGERLILGAQAFSRWPLEELSPLNTL